MGGLAFEEEEDKLRELAREKGRKASEKVFNATICPSLRALKLDQFACMQSQELAEL